MLQLKVDVFGRSHCNGGQLEEAEAAVTEGLQLARELGKTLREAQGLRILAQTLGQQQCSQSRTKYWGVDGIAQQPAMRCRGILRLQLARGNHYQAMSSAKKSKKLSTTDEDKDGWTATCAEGC